MSDDFIMPIIGLLIAISAVLSWFIMRWLGNICVRTIRILVAGFLPVTLLVLLIGIWHYVELLEYRVSGAQEGFMGPLLILLYGFPYFILMIVIDFVAAVSFRKRK